MSLSIARCRPPRSFRLQLPRSPQRNSLRQLSTATSILPDDIYDVAVVGGGIAGLALATGLCIHFPTCPA